MFKSILYNIFFISLVCFTTSCEEDFLDKTPDEDLSVDDVFESRNYTEEFLNNVYSHIPAANSFNENMYRNPFVPASDEMELTWTYPFSQQINAGAWNPVNTPSRTWDENYMGIRKANIFLEKIDGTNFQPDVKETWKGEAYFLRALYHFFNLRVYGPIPLLDHSVSTDADYESYVRRPFEECVQFIVADCERAIELLDPVIASDERSTMMGRATGVAAHALKARILLYAASPLYNGNPAYASVENLDGTNLFPTEYDHTKWQVAADAAKEAIDVAEANGKMLYRHPSGNAVYNYQYLFLEPFNEEILFAKHNGNWDFMERLTTPTSLGGWSGYSPTQDLVDSYQMANGEEPILGYNPDGSPIINPASGYSESGFTNSAGPEGTWQEDNHNMYVNREPRFYASINYNGQDWRGRTLQFYLTGADGKGKGGPDFSVTGYTMKKMSSPNVNIVQHRWVPSTWIYFRLGELYLNYAEALNEAQGPVGDVHTYLNAIRDRSGLPDVDPSLSKEEMRERIWHERKIELAFESHRYFDTRRWKIAEITADQPIHGMNVSAGTSLQDEDFYERVVVEDRVFVEPKHYLWPIPQEERNKNPLIVQNKDW